MSDRHYWQARLVKGGPYVGVMTWYGPPLVDGEEMDRSPRWQALVHTEKTARAILMGDQLPIEVDGVGLRGVEPVPEPKYRYLVAHAGWAVVADPSHPEAQPNKSIDFHTLAPRF